MSHVADDMMKGVRAFSEFTGDSQRRTNNLLEKGALPAFKFGGIWHMRKSAYLAMIDRLEAQAGNGRAA